MAPQDDLLEKLCTSSETLNTAHSILRLAKQKTGPGSGYEIGSLKTGLPAVCACIASRRLNSNEVTRKNAQVASCLKPADFDKVMNMVENAIGEGRILRGQKDIYDVLIKQYASASVRQDFLNWLGAVNRALVLSVNPDDLERAPVWKYAMFFWTYGAATGKVIPQQEFIAEQQLNSKTFPKYVAKITGCCSSVKARIENDIKAKRSPAKSAGTTTPRRSPKKPARILPTNDSPTKRKVVEPEPEMEPEPEPAAQQASGDEIEDIHIPKTPSKKRKLDIPTKSILKSSPTKPVLRSSPTKPFPPPVASSSRVTLDVPPDMAPPRTPAKSKSLLRAQKDPEPMNVDRETDTALARASPRKGKEPEEDLRPRRRRFYPVYLDHKQWYAADKRVKRIWRQAEEHKEHMVELYGHPLESLRA